MSEQIEQVQAQVNKELELKNNQNIEVDSELTAKTFNKSTENTQNNSNTINLSDAFEKNAQNEDFSNEFDNKENQFQEQPKETLELKAKVQEDVDIQQDESVVQDKKVVFEEKQSFINEIKEDILLDIDYTSIPDNSGALSVSDEVIRLAMDDVGVLKNDTTIKGSLLYDTASGNVAVIKNAAQMIKGAQINQNPILNQLENSDLMSQIGDKLTQLKDASNQKLTLVLRPNDLGRLSIELTSNNLGLTTNILAQNDDVRQYIEKNIQTLRQQLVDAGISVNNIQIKTAGQEGSTNYQGNQHFNQNSGNEQNSQNQNHSNNEQNQKERQETLLAMSNYDYHFAKDFSGVLNKTINYGLN